MDHEDESHRAVTACDSVTGVRPRPRLRLVVSHSQAVVPTLAMWRPGPFEADPPVALPKGSYRIRFTASRRSGALQESPYPDLEKEGRLDVRPREGKKMKTFEKWIHAAGRFSVGFGIGLALVCAFVIVTTDGLVPQAKPEVVRLEPVVVTISAERFAEIRSEKDREPVLVRSVGHGPGDG